MDGRFESDLKKSVLEAGEKHIGIEPSGNLFCVDRGATGDRERETEICGEKHENLKDKISISVLKKVVITGGSSSWTPLRWDRYVIPKRR